MDKIRRAFWLVALLPVCLFRKHAWYQRANSYKRDSRHSVSEDDRFCARCGAFSRLGTMSRPYWPFGTWGAF